MHSKKKKNWSGYIPSVLERAKKKWSVNLFSFLLFTNLSNEKLTKIEMKWIIKNA
jgi:hypothetical protein